ncbi:MAG: Mur ligase family protein [Patescibacteria group bacterium]|nr:Mur ligase family protein [Patescibacteria group bacterium]
MSTILTTIILILVFLKITRDSLFYLWLWQVKEYRIDRMKSYLKENSNVGSIVPLGLWSSGAKYKTSQNANAKRLHINTPQTPLKRGIATMEPAAVYFIGLVLILISYFNQSVFAYLVLIFFIFTFYQIIKEIKKRALKRPRFTFKVILIFFLEAIFYFSFFAFYWIPASAGMTNSLILFLLFFYLITPILIAVIILFTNPFFNFQKKRIIKRASLKMRNLKKIRVIGITGSYGKTSTKEFLYTILNQKYKVVKTEGNNNTNIGVAYTVLNKVNDDYDYFICEMGAYKIGEIKEMCKIVEPEIGILTGINEQHLELFGSMENTIKAKFELIESLPENGLAIINSSIKYQVLSIKLENIKHFSLDSVSDIRVYQDCVKFIYKNQKFKADFLGKHYIENLLAAIITAKKLGMNLKEISEAVKKIKPSKFMMRKLWGPDNSVFIDDSYSANPDGVIVALDYLDEAYKDYQKIIVFSGIIELGKSSEGVHKKLFDRIGEVCDMAYILNQDTKSLYSPARPASGHKGIMEPANKCEFVFEKDFDKMVNMLRNNLEKNTVVLFESRGAGVVMKKLKNIK